MRAMLERGLWAVGICTVLCAANGCLGSAPAAAAPPTPGTFSATGSNFAIGLTPASRGTGGVETRFVFVHVFRSNSESVAVGVFEVSADGNEWVECSGDYDNGRRSMGVKLRPAAGRTWRKVSEMSHLEILGMAGMP